MKTWKRKGRGAEGEALAFGAHGERGQGALQRGLVYREAE